MAAENEEVRASKPASPLVASVAALDELVDEMAQDFVSLADSLKAVVVPTPKGEGSQDMERTIGDGNGSSPVVQRVDSIIRKVKTLRAAMRELKSSSEA